MVRDHENRSFFLTESGSEQIFPAEPRKTTLPPVFSCLPRSCTIANRTCALVTGFGVYANCAEARAVCVAPVRRREQEHASHLDPDGVRADAEVIQG